MYDMVLFDFNNNSIAKIAYTLGHYCTKQIVYILVLILILTISIILLTKRDYTRKYQIEIYCRLGDDNITILIELDENKKYVIHYSGNQSDDLNACDTLDEANHKKNIY